MLIFLDTQTTGLEKTDKICSIAVITGDKEFYELVNEGKKIPPLASSIHHITNEMIKDKTPLKDSEVFKFLEENNNEETTIVGHNIKFDLEKLSEIGFYFKGKIIDTLKVTKHLIQECELFSLQFLRYELRLYKNEPLGIVAHNALGNTLLVRELFNYLLDITTLEDMYNLSFEKVLLEKFSFGKYAGRYIEEISMQDRGYLEWMLRDISDLDEDLRYSIKYYLGDNLEDCY